MQIIIPRRLVLRGKVDKFQGSNKDIERTAVHREPRNLGAARTNIKSKWTMIGDLSYYNIKSIKTPKMAFILAIDCDLDLT